MPEAVRHFDLHGVNERNRTGSVRRGFRALHQFRSYQRQNGGREYACDRCAKFWPGRDAIAPQVDGKFMSAFVRAVKPAGVAGRGAARDQ